MAFDASEWKSTGGTARRYVNTKTGQSISRWAYQKLKKGIDFKEAAENARLTNPKLAALRPARGRRSAVKDEAKELIAQARIEDRQRRKEIAEAEKEQRKLDRMIQRARNKKVRRKKVTKAALKPGRRAIRIAFNTYDEYVEILREARNIGVVAFVGLGVVGIDENTGEERDATVFRMDLVSATLSREDFDDGMEEFLLSKSYFIFSHYFAHVAYRSDYANEKAKRK